MSEQTGIEWCDSTFNPWIGCTKVGPGCDHCYAETRMDKRLKIVSWGPGNPRKRTSDKLWGDVYKWNDMPFYQCECGWRGAQSELTSIERGMFDGIKDVACPACDRVDMKTARRRVFCASLADVFDNEVDPAWRADLLYLINSCKNIDFLLLTKRIGNVVKMVEEADKSISRVTNSLNWPMPNVWLGITVVNQAEADRDIPKLLNTPAAIRFLSLEPLTEAVSLSAWIECSGMPSCIRCEGRLIDWVILGGESGPSARPMHPGWVRNMRDQCLSAHVPFLFKQWGEWVDGGNVPKGAENRIWFAKGRSVFDMRDLDLLRDFEPAYPPGAPYFGCSYVVKVGKKAAGRMLDGKTHDGYPKVNL